MRIEIDQSGKIEQTNKPTVIAFSNGKSGTILTTSIEKQKLQKEFRRIGKTQAFVYQTFNVLIYLLIRKYISKLDLIIIDREYPGKENQIKDHICALFVKNGIKVDRKIIQFKEIGKSAKAHNLVWETFRNRKSGIKVNARDILSVLYE